MTSAPDHPAGPLDRISAIMDSKERPLDGALIVRLREVPTLEDLEEGAASARATYPITTCVLRGRQWQPGEPEAITVGDDIDAFLDRGAPIGEVPSPRQLVAGDRLVTVGHHAAGDLVSILTWVRHQLDVAFGRTPAPLTELELKTHDRPVRKSRFAHAGASTRLWCRGQPSGTRRRRTLHLAPFTPNRDEGVTFNDVLLAVTLDAYYQFNCDHGAKTDRIAVWCPVNIRTRPFDGFGNGSSRVRIYRDNDASSFLERCKSVHEQVQWTKAHGEWFVPTDHPLFSAPDWVIRMYLSRPWVDMATGAFSHGQRIGAGPDEVLWPEVEDVEVVGQLDRRHPFGVFGVTFRGTTRLTLLYDPAQLEPEDVDALSAMYTDGLAAAKAALT